MNIFKLPALWLLTAAVAFAQPAAPKAAPPAVNPVAAPVAAPAAIPPAFLDSIISMEPTPSSSSEIAVYLQPVSSSSAEAPAVPEGKTIFDSVRGHAYNPYGTVGAASTVLDLVTTPSDINGQKFFYVSPTDRLGYTAFGAGEGSILLGLDRSPLGSPAALIFGYANSDFGFALNYSVAKNWHTTKGTVDVSTATTGAGDNIGLYFSVPLGSATFYANAGWLTYALSESVDADGDETSTDFSEIQGNAGLTGSSGSLNYDVYLNVIRTGGTGYNKDDDKFVDANSYLGSALHFKLSFAALQSSTARVLVGSNNFLSMAFYDKIKTPSSKGDSQIGFVISPNILGEIAFTPNWLAFAGAVHSINLVAGDLDRNSKTSDFTIAHSSGTGATTGLRYQRTNWAAEASVASDLFNNPFGGFNGRTMFYSFGGFINF